MDLPVTQRPNSLPTGRIDGETCPGQPGGALPAGTRLREFEISETIGEGGFSIVYAARDHQLGREVAIKEFIPSSLAGRASGSTVRPRSEQHRESFAAGLAGFMNEARLLAQFKHPALVEVLQFWEENGTAYMVMPRYRGKTLRTVLKERGRACDEPWLKRTLAPVLDVLALLHSRRVYHRDVAPDNIIVLTDGSAVLLDLGSAREILGDREASVTVVVKPGYAPLEQYSGEFALPQGPWTDVYAFGALLHFAVTGSPPQAAISRIMKDGREPLSAIAPDGFSSRFLAGIDRALALQPADRPQCVRELADALGMHDLSTPATGATASTIADVGEHHDDAITAIVSADEMADIVEQVSRSLGLPAVAASAAPATLPVADASSVQALNDPGPAAKATPDAAIDPFAAPARNAHEPANAFPEMADLLSGRLVAATDDIRVVSEAVAERAGAVADPAAATPRFSSGMRWAAGFGLIAVGILAIGIGLRSDDAGPATNTPGEPTQPAGQSTATAAASPQEQASTFERRELTPLQPAEPWMPPVFDDAFAATPLDVLDAAFVDTAGPLAEVDLQAAVMPARPAPARPAAATPTGTVLLSIAPWGEVWVNGEKRGVSPPLRELQLPTGSHRIELRSPGLNSHSQTLQVSSDAPVTLEHRFNGALAPSPPGEAEPAVAAAAEPASPPRATAAATRPPARPAPTPAPASETGTLRLSVAPWGEVWVNGEKRGISPPLRELRLPAGTYQIELRNPGLPSHSRAVQLQDGESIAVEHRFRATADSAEPH
jgi:non-specific serine/threonine protein kinase